MKLTALISIAGAVALTSSLAFGQAATSPAPAASQSAPKPRSAKSIECSKEADAKALHGKQRRKFLSECNSSKM